MFILKGNCTMEKIIFAEKPMYRREKDDKEVTEVY